jgi:formylglycine-generating enzyme required for sulfatase activity
MKIVSQSHLKTNQPYSGNWYDAKRHLYAHVKEGNKKRKKMKEHKCILSALISLMLCFSFSIEVVAQANVTVPTKVRTETKKPTKKPVVKKNKPRTSGSRRSGSALRSTSTEEYVNPNPVSSRTSTEEYVNPNPASSRTSTEVNVNSNPLSQGMSSEEKERIIQKLVSNMVYVSGGTFKMGGKRKPFFDEKPTHSVTLSSYYIGKYEVTQAEWKTVMGSNPSEIKGDDRPVENVSWDDCQTFISRLNSITGRSFSLPTEAQWEFSARGGNSSRGYKYSGSNNVGDVAWYIDNSGGTTHDVGTKSPNELGLYDMSGNVWEWCSDWGGNYSSNSQTNPTGPSSGSGRVNRGGSCGGLAGGCRVSCRYFNSPGRRYGGMGLRLVL